MVKRDSFKILQKKSSTLPRVVWAEESKTGLRFKSDQVMTSSQRGPDL